jgi:hypothetical protein
MQKTSGQTRLFLRTWAMSGDHDGASCLPIHSYGLQMANSSLVVGRCLDLANGRLCVWRNAAVQLCFLNLHEQ